jgi:hypothetical protein
VPTPPPRPTKPRPSVPGPSRPADPDREPAPSPSGSSAVRSAVASGGANSSVDRQGATPSSWPPAQAGTADTQPEPAKAKADPHITEQRIRPQIDPVDAAQANDKVDAVSAAVSADAVSADAVSADGDRADAGKVEAAQADTGKADAGKSGKRKPEGSLARLAAYKAEVAELLGGDSAARRRGKNTTASGLPAPDPTTQEPQIKLTRPPRKGGSRSKD